MHFFKFRSIVTTYLTMFTSDVTLNLALGHEL